MKILRFFGGTNTLKLRVDTLDDLWTIQRVIFKGDIVEAKSERRFRPSEGDIGELKDVIIALMVEKTELDKNAVRLRVTGKIIEGRPLEYVKLNSYHTLNIAPRDTLEIRKSEWKDYLVAVLRNAVSDSRKPRLGLIVIDDEKALPAYLLGYGVDFKNEIYSHLSKRMTQKEFQEEQNKYFNRVIDLINEMPVDTVVVAGPGFTREDVKKYGADTGRLKKGGKNVIFESVSNAERSGMYELIRGAGVARILERERIRQEFSLMEEFLTNLSTGTSRYGIENVRTALESGSATHVLVNDSILGLPDVQETLSLAERVKIRIEVFNSADEAGQQLHGFSDIASIVR